MDACLGIYKDNAPGRFPDGYLGEFETALQSPSNLYLVVESANRVVGVGGITRVPDYQFVGLQFGMIHPEFHRRGFGSALLLARLSCLPAPDPWQYVYLTAVGHSAGYYTRFGFEYCGRSTDQSTGQELDNYRSRLGRSAWASCRTLLARSNVRMQTGGCNIPVSDKR